MAGRNDSMPAEVGRGGRLDTTCEVLAELPAFDLGTIVSALRSSGAGRSGTVAGSSLLEDLEEEMKTMGLLS